MGNGGRQDRRAPFWFPDWRGKTCVLVASGPSLEREQIEQVEGLPVLVINSSWLLAPDADVLYACDGQWWDSEDGQKALAEFGGVKVTQDGGAADRYGLARVNLADDHRILVDSPGIIGRGEHGGFQALNLAIQFGAKRIILLGYDMHDDGGIHWHGKHKGALNNPNLPSLVRWRDHYAQNAGAIAALGVEITNCTPGSALTCFTRKPLRDALESLHTAS